jgi:PAS domain S-box-containing protein
VIVQKAQDSPELRGAAEPLTEKVYAAERAVGGVRLAVLLFTAAVYFVLLDRSLTIPRLALPLILVALVYSLVVVVFEPYRRFPILLSSYVTTASDALLIALWIVATGGVDSPFYVIWYGAVVAIAFRFEMRGTLLISTLYVVIYLATLATLGQVSGHLLEVTVRSGYMLLIATLAALLSHYAAEQARAKMANYERVLVAERAERIFSELLQSCPEAIAVHSEGHLAYVNPAAVALLGAASAEEIVGRAVLDFVHPDSLDAARERAQRAYEEVSSPLVERLVRLDGTAFDAEVQGTPIVYHGRRAAQLIIRDVSAAKAAERMRRDLVAMMSHDLKNPLSVVLGFVDILREEIPNTPQTHDLLDRLEANGRRAITLAINFVDAARIESGELVLQRGLVSVNDLVRDVVRCQASLARLRRISVDTVLEDDLPAIEVDRQLIERVVANLLSNAIKYSQEGGRVRIETARKNGRIMLAVADQGPGVAAEDRPKLFQRYGTLAASRSGSTGLGLFIVKTIVEAHGGTVGMEFPPAGGSVFAVHLNESAIVEQKIGESESCAGREPRLEAIAGKRGVATTTSATE